MAEFANGMIEMSQILSQWALLFTQLPWLFVAFAISLGLLLGSFLNVVIHRLPLMMERAWLTECAESLAQPIPPSHLPTRFNLIVPHSSCPHCQTAIKPWHNIPLLSFLWLKGRCHHCQAKIALRYPLIELITGLVSGFLAWQFGPTLTFFAAWLLTLGLISLAAIDFDTMLLPDSLTLPLLWLGLLLNVSGLFVPLEQAVIGAAAGYGALWLLFWAFKLLTGKEGMGYGDFKLLALFGAWFGYGALLPIMLFASVVGSVFALVLMANKKLAQGNPMPFGPWIALGGWLYLIAGEPIINWYFAVVFGR